MDVDNPGTVLSGDPEEQKRYNEIVIQQLTELWGNYGELFEIWFDGGVLPPEMGGPDVVPLLKKLQPRVNVFQGRQGMRNLLRWAGNEDGKPPYPCWSTASLEKNDFDGTEDCPAVGTGHPFAPIWAPAEADLPNRNARLSSANGWFWAEGEDGLVQSAGHLFERYLDSVGCNTNMLVGMVIDDRGLVPDEDVRQFTWFGELKDKAFGEQNLLGESSGSGDGLTLEIETGRAVSYIVLMEDIFQGERVLEYKILGLEGSEWRELFVGSAVGHKRIHCMKYPKPENLSAIKFVCLKSKAGPIIRKMAVYS
jgi:alpha-L-fucosidase